MTSEGKHCKECSGRGIFANCGDHRLVGGENLPDAAFIQCESCRKREHEAFIASRNPSMSKLKESIELFQEAYMRELSPGYTPFSDSSNDKKEDILKSLKIVFECYNDVREELHIGKDGKFAYRQELAKEYERFNEYGEQIKKLKQRVMQLIE